MSLPTFIAHPLGIGRLVDDGGAQRLIDGLAAGDTLSSLAKHYGTSRGALTRYIDSLPPAMHEAIKAADSAGASALAEQTIALADDAAEQMMQPRRIATKDGDVIEVDPDASAFLTATKMQISTRQWFAERKHAEMWGGKVTANVQVNIGAIHLDALRHRNAQQAEIAVIAPPDTESLDDLL